MELVKGFVKISGASDLEDSSAAAGLCTLIDYPVKADLVKYIRPDGMYQRCDDSKYLFSRDQTICLWAGMYVSGYSELISQDRVDGKDIFPPSVKGHEKRCKGLQPNLLDKWWLWLDVYFHAIRTPTDESNQLLAMMIVAFNQGEKCYLRWWCENNDRWEYSIRRYWYMNDGAWRNEQDFAEALIAYVKGLISTK